MQETIKKKNASQHENTDPKKTSSLKESDFIKLRAAASFRSFFLCQSFQNRNDWSP